MPWASPTSGASSTEPCTRTTSAWRPVAAKCTSAVRGYLVATRTAPRCSRARRGRVLAVHGGVDHAALAEAQVEQLVDVRRLLAQHVPAHDAEVGRAALDVGGDVAAGAW